MISVTFAMNVNLLHRSRSFHSQLVELKKIFIRPSHYKKILPSQPIRARILLL